MGLAERFDHVVSEGLKTVEYIQQPFFFQERFDSRSIYYKLFWKGSISGIFIINLFNEEENIGVETEPEPKVFYLTITLGSFHEF